MSPRRLAQGVLDEWRGGFAEYGKKEIDSLLKAGSLRYQKAILFLERGKLTCFLKRRAKEYQKVILFLRKYSIPDTKVMMTAMYMIHWPSCNWANG